MVCKAKFFLETNFLKIYFMLKLLFMNCYGLAQELHEVLSYETQGPLVQVHWSDVKVDLT
jgi:hypothetical protein